MPKPVANYFRYFTPSVEMPAWGLAITASGFTKIAAGERYPPARHPSDHHLDWAKGRVLEALQIVLVTAGGGQMEMDACDSQRVEGGTAFAVLPNVWHRYQPDPSRGWTESWIEIQGPTVEQLLLKGVFKTETVIRLNALAAGLDVALESVHALARLAGPGFDPELSARAFSVLAAWNRCGNRHGGLSSIRKAVVAAERHLAENHTTAVNVEALSRRLGVAYSHFRREFREHTGFAPWKYVMHLRLTHARRLLASGDATLDDIASRLGFSSAFHFSAAFKQVYRLSPDRWRRQLRRERRGDS
ncbi:MAG TPA: AraC family transcriptional regulator [Lacunisphaera sp.]